MIRFAFVALSLLALTLPRLAHADDTAALAYQQAEQLEKQGKWAEACPLYEASYRADPQIGVLLHLANCHEQVGKLASAWAEFNDVVELAHRRGDNRESLAKTRADALKPKLAYLHVAAPPSPPPGLVITRDGIDITVLVGADLPIDPGAHDITATAPGYVDFTKHVAIAAAPGTTQLAIPALQKQPEKTTVPVAPAEPAKHEGAITITTQADAHITLDSSDVGVGGYKGKLRSGGHTLRVTAPGMRPYQSEIFVGDDETRTIDVPLEKEQAAVVLQGRAAEPEANIARHQFALSFAPGEKFHDGNAGVIAYRLEYSHRFGLRVDLGLYTEYASVSAASTCGTSIPGPMSSSPFDYGTHYRFDGCSFITAGFQLYVHLAPRGRIDPYVGIAPGFRFGFVDLQAYQGGVASGSSSSEFMPGVGFYSRVGVDYHPSPSVPGWAVGAFVDVHTMIVGQETFSGNGGTDSPATGYVSLFGGARTALAF